MFFATASAEAGWDVQLSFMTRRGKAHDDAETSARLTPEAHAAAYEGCAPGATIDKVWGALERGRVVSAAETDAREVACEADDTSDFAFDDGAITGLESGEETIACAVSDPAFHDCPLVFVSKGFEELTGYSADFATGRSCRFLQPKGPDVNDSFNGSERELLRSFCLEPSCEGFGCLLLNERESGSRSARRGEI